MAYRYEYSNELTHYGVKGQKWGVRRAQKKESIKRGKELSKRLKDPNEIRWNEDRNNRLINKMSKQDWQDVKNYEKDRKTKAYVATALGAIGGVSVAYLVTKK